MRYSEREKEREDRQEREQRSDWEKGEGREE